MSDNPTDPLRPDEPGPEEVPPQPRYGQYGEQPPYGQQPQPPYGQQPQPPYGQGAGGYPPPAGGFPSAPQVGDTTTPGWARQQPLTVGQAVSYGWSKFWANAGTWIAACIVVFVIAVVIQLVFNATVRAGFGGGTSDELRQRLDDARTTGSLLLAAVGSILTYVVLAFLVTGAIATTYKGRAEFADFFRLRNVGQIVILAVVVGVLNFVLGFIPILGALITLVVEFFLTFALYFVLDANRDALTAIRSSFEVVSRSPGVVLVLILATIGIAIVGALICGVGLLAAVPIGLLAYAFAYRRLTGGQPV